MHARLVLDTNTILALWMFRDPCLSELCEWIESGDCILVTREDALLELRHVLAYPQFGLDETRQHTLMATYRARTALLTTASSTEAQALPACKDADDQKFLEIALDAGATSLITRDKALLKLARHRRVRERFAILTPERFLTQLPLRQARPDVCAERSDSATR